MKTLYWLLLLTIPLPVQSSPSLPAFSQGTQQPEEPAELVEAATLSDKGKALFKEQKPRDALPLARRALEIRERLLPADDLRIEASLALLGDVQLALFDFDAAKKSYQSLLQKQEQRLGSSDGNLAPTLDRICIVNYRLRHDDQAEEACTRSLKIKEAALGPSHPDVAYTLYLLAEQHRKRRNTDQAATFYLRAISIYNERPGERHPQFEEVHEGFYCLCQLSQKPELLAKLEAMRQSAIDSNDPVITERRVLNGRALSLPKPAYSAEARRKGEEGKIIVKVMIDETGKVISAYDMCEGPQWISVASVQAAMRARFSPTKLSGMPVKVSGIIQYMFIR